ncbi:MAG: adenylate/guanylate cyclase domain-containing protein [Burkholderiales bacterium]|nr:adenylate/guanylate cyclase domain-containing protein [Burkholderiales bacterium]
MLAPASGSRGRTGAARPWIDARSRTGRSERPSGGRLKKNAARIVFGLVVVFVFIGHAADKWYRIPLIDRLEALAYDARLNLTMPATVDERIVIVDIDENSLRPREEGGEGRWPWPRNRMALMVDHLFERYGAAIVGFDVVFAEPDESSGLNVLRELARDRLKDDERFQSALSQLEPQLSYDRLFADRIRQRPVVLGYYFSPELRAAISGVLPAPVLPPGTFAGKNIPFYTAHGYGANLPELVKAAAGAGHFNPSTDSDGVSRRVPMLAEYKGAYYEPLSLAMVRVLLGLSQAAKAKSTTVALPQVVPGYPSDAIWSRGYQGLEWLQVGPVRIPVDDKVTALVPYRGKQGSFKYLPAADVIQGKANPDDLKGKIVLVGTTAPGLFDLRSTPVASVYPGVEIHANLIAGMLDQTIKQKPPYVLGAEIVLLMLTGVAMTFLLPLLTPVKQALATAVVLLATVGSNVWVFHEGNLVLPLASGVLMILVLFTFSMAYGFFVEARGKRQITGLFGQYVPPELVDEMAKNPEHFSMAPESREMTVLFSDVRGFTTISEGLEPKELSNLMNEFLTPLTEVIYSHRGTIDKYMGDAIMAFWGAPLAAPDHARQAIHAALQMHRKLAELQPHFHSRNWPEIRIGVGLNTGRMSVGNMGSRIRLAYTVMGDAVNLASRLEGITKEYGAAIIVGETTRELTAHDFVFRELDRVRVKGKLEPVAIYEPIGVVGEVDKRKLDELKLFNQAVKLYRAQEWDMAELQLLNLLKFSPESKLYQLYVDRVGIYRAHSPGRDWDGAFTFEHK